MNESLEVRIAALEQRLQFLGADKPISRGGEVMPIVTDDIDTMDPAANKYLDGIQRGQPSTAYKALQGENGNWVWAQFAPQVAEGTAILSTGEDAGLVLTSDGAGGASWEALSGDSLIIGALLNPTRRVLGWYIPSLDLASGAAAGLGFEVGISGTGEVDVFDGLAHLETSGAADTIVAYFSGGVTAADNLLMAYYGTCAPPNAALTSWAFGFMEDADDHGDPGAFFRRLGTNNVFAVTDDGTNETATDLGALSDGEIREWRVWTDDAGVTWRFAINGTQVAAHTATVPATDQDYDIANSVVSSNTLASTDTAAIQSMLAICDRQS